MTSRQARQEQAILCCYDNHQMLQRKKELAIDRVLTRGMEMELQGRY